MLVVFWRGCLGLCIAIMSSFGCFVPVKRSSLQWPVMCGTDSTPVIIAMWRAGEMACGKDRLRGEETWIHGSDDVSAWSAVSWWCPSKTDQCQPVFDTSRSSDISCCKTLLWIDYHSLLTYLLTYLSMLWVGKVEVFITVHKNVSSTTFRYKNFEKWFPVYS